MPIIQINMAPNETNQMELARILQDAVVSFSDIKGILPGEVMVDVHTNGCNLNGFIYVKIMIYHRKERTDEILKRFQDFLGNIIAEYFDETWNNFKWLEMLPLEVLDDKYCKIYLSSRKCKGR